MTSGRSLVKARTASIVWRRRHHLLTADHHLNILRDLSCDVQFPLQPERRIKPELLGPLIEKMAIDQTFFAKTGLDPVAVKEIVAFDVINVILVQHVMGKSRRLDRHTIARNHLEMRGACKCVRGSFDCVEGRPRKAPFTPTAFDAALCKRNVGVF
jgi:hypothetical protein